MWNIPSDGDTHGSRVVRRVFGDRPALAPKGRSRTVNKQLHISNGVQVGQWKLGPIWAVETGPNLGSGNWTQIGQWILCYTQCGCFMSFLSFRFYVKSIMKNVEVLKLPFWPFRPFLKFVNLVHFILQNVQKKKNQNSQPLNVLKMADFALLESPKLVSRKIWVIEKSCNFHTVFHSPVNFLDPNWAVDTVLHILTSILKYPLST